MYLKSNSNFFFFIYNSTSFFQENQRIQIMLTINKDLESNHAPASAYLTLFTQQNQSLVALPRGLEFFFFFQFPTSLSHASKSRNDSCLAQDCLQLFEPLRTDYAFYRVR